MPKSYKLPFRITIGVTGHRNLDPGTFPALRTTLQRILDDIKSRHAYDGQTTFGWRILTPLAEGADRLVAEEVLKRSEGTVLKAVLPLTVADYLEDFTTDQSKKEFKDLLARDRSPISLKKIPLQNEYPPEMAKEARKQAYEDVGTFVVDHCDILIALWNGEDGGKGGTAQIVTYAGKQECPRYTIFTSTPHEFEFTPGMDDIERQYKKLNHLNRQIAAAASLEQGIQKKYDDLFSSREIKAESGKLPDKLKEDIRAHLLPYYVVADDLAIKYQNTYMHTGTWVFAFALIATSIVATGVIFLNRPWYIFAIELLILCIIAGSIWHADKIKGAHKNWRAYRFLAERIRCATFLAAGGIEPVPLFISRRDGAEKDYLWLIMAFDEIWNKMPRWRVPDDKELELRKNFIVKAWIDDQIQYHLDNAHAKISKSKKWEIIGEVVFYCATAAAAVHLLFPLFHFHSSVIDNILVFIALILPSVATVAESIRSHRQFKYLAVHSRMMTSELKKIGSSFTLLTPSRFENLLLETDSLMMKEVQEWIALTGSIRLSKAV